LNVTTGADNALSGQSNERPNVAGNPIPAAQSINQWLLPAAFGSPLAGSYGNLGINAFKGPGYLGFDVAVVRSFPIRERQKLEFRAEGFNVVNRLNANNPTASLSSPTFGRVISEMDPRILQLALKFLF
jgi:hypothetical protein